MIRQRLNDREQRNNKSLNRKQVFLVEESSDFFVEVVFSRDYISLFKKTLNAFAKVPQQFIGELLGVDQEGLTLKVSYLGKTLEPTLVNLPKVVGFLRNLQSEQAKQGVFATPRYISALYERTNDQKVELLVNYLNDASFVCATGYGIDDPVLSNFTEDDKGVHLIDLDHFTEDISLYYQVGFACADIDLIANKDFRLTNNLCETFTTRNEPITVGDATALVSGYTSRLAIDVINDSIGIDSYRSEESIKHIYILADALMHSKK